MTISRTQSSDPASQSLRFILAVIAIVAGALGLFYWLMRPSMNEIGLMALFLSITSIITIIAGYAAYRSGWLSNSPRLRWALLGTYALSSILTFINVWVTARLMFASSHDLLLATVLLLFAGGIAMALGHFLSETLTRRISALNRAAKKIAEGDFEIQVDTSGRDEMAELAGTFNSMAAQLEATSRKQKQLDTLRTDLIAWVSHDLQTPLASIQAIVEALADGMVEDPDTSQRYLRTAQREIQSLSALIDDLFQMAQIDAGGLQLDLERNSLTDLISDSIESFSRIAQQQHIQLEGKVKKGLDPVMMDAQRISRVLSNLISNAIRHTPAGGSVVVEGSRIDGQVEVVVRDTGDGIPEQDLPRIFDRFYRGEKSRSRDSGGAGLGLSIVKGIVDAHGGQLFVKNLPDAGTSFKIILPDEITT